MLNLLPTPHSLNPKPYTRLYVRRVFISDEFDDLMPRYLSFIRGVNPHTLNPDKSRNTWKNSKYLKNSIFF